MRCYVFPGQGVQKKGMGRSLFGRFPELCSRADEVLGYSVEELCLQNPERRLGQTEYAQPAIYVVNALRYLAAQDEVPAPDYLAGHSLGEYSALFAAGAFDFETGLALVKRRAELMGRADDGAMAAVVGLSEGVVEQTLKANDVGGVVIANYNSPEQFVLSGAAEELARLKTVFEKVEGVRGFVPVRVSGAFHSPLMAPAAAEFRDFLASVDVCEFRTPVISNVTGRPFEAGAQAVRELLAEQLTKPVRWIESVRYLRQAGVSEFTELSETKVLTQFIDKISAVEEPTADPRHDLINRIKREVLQPEIGEAALSFGTDQSFRELGLNSIIYVRLARRVQTAFGIQVKPDVIFQHRTCAALADYLLARDAVAPAEPKEPAPWREYQDERVLALLQDCANGALPVDQVIEAIRAGLASAAG
jgi:[acyl-carrier-protein] S-malonyltransferase/polyketide biosynthesis malonyl-CoA-[acyl-carrier-protein] transacylase